MRVCSKAALRLGCPVGTDGRKVALVLARIEGVSPAPPPGIRLRAGQRVRRSVRGTPEEDRRFTLAWRGRQATTSDLGFVSLRGDEFARGAEREKSPGTIGKMFREMREERAFPRDDEEHLRPRLTHSGGLEATE